MKVPNYDPYEDASDAEESTSSYAFYTDDSDEEASGMDKLKWTIGLAKADCLGTINYNVDNFMKETKRDVERRLIGSTRRSSRSTCRRTEVHADVVHVFWCSINKFW